MPLPFEATASFAARMDQADVLASFRERFLFPVHEGKQAIYFCGNSLGLQPTSAAAAFQAELTSWQQLAIDGYFSGAHPWLAYHKYLQPALASVTGAQPHEITVMNALTVNLHLLLSSFYRPSGERFKILMEAGAFPSDQYAAETQVKHHGLEPAKAIVEVAPRPGEKILREADVLAAIDQNKSSLALVLLGGIHYYTGQLLDIKTITQAAHQAGALAGWDLAHVTGNVPTQLHDWNADFAVWCSYKYLNGGPGAAGGVFIHERHAYNSQINRLAGWWGNDEKSRFKMEKGFVPKQDASGWNVSTTQVFNMVALKASLEIFEDAGIHRLRTKSIALTGYLEFLLRQLRNLDFEIITPSADEQRGAQLCLFFKTGGRQVYEKMIHHGIVADYREPGVIRVAPAPLYCSFEDVFVFYQLLAKF